MKQYIVDAFAPRPFTGNPAAVCVMDAWPTEESMMLLARENNLSETAFIVGGNGHYHLRWFTPGCEVELCGHATLASAYTVMEQIEPGLDEVRFDTLGGELVIRRDGDVFLMDLPTYELHEIPVTHEMTTAFGARPSRAVLRLDLICVFDDEETVRAMRPDQTLLMTIPGRIQNATARGTDVDCVSRSFCPKLAIPEDPVCGSAHCQIADFWCRELGKPEILAYQASERGGYLRCRPLGEGRVEIGGEASLVAVSEIVAPLP
ncbi:PhzF family phenazine biosynthesis protein [Slackia heliotrinireducens]|uniref:PhzF family phenazine biosynthesis protein n=1 Tax=Slackia heliotrinireducens TaxID=84110 RepID=UPI0033163902